MAPSSESTLLLGTSIYQILGAVTNRYQTHCSRLLSAVLNKARRSVGATLT